MDGLVVVRAAVIAKNLAGICRAVLLGPTGTKAVARPRRFYRSLSWMGTSGAISSSSRMLAPRIYDLRQSLSARMRLRI